jgi:hypothetical protein
MARELASLQMYLPPLKLLMTALRKRNGNRPCRQRWTLFLRTMGRIYLLEGKWWGANGIQKENWSRWLNQTFQGLSGGTICFTQKYGDD